MCASPSRVSASHARLPVSVQATPGYPCQCKPRPATRVSASHARLPVSVQATLELPDGLSRS
jgi:hypothetical protein